MTIVLAGLIVTLIAGYLVAGLIVLRHLQARDTAERDERARDARERTTVESRHAAQVEGFVKQIREAQDARADEIASLLQRIQAPEIAVIQHQQATAEPDESYPLNDVETAEIQERQLALERIERMEREGVLS